MHATELHVNLRGIRLMAGAMACFVVNDMLVKIVSQQLPAAQLIFLRGLMASLLICGLLLRCSLEGSGLSPTPRRHRPAAAR